jgi:hypothetical protein
VSPDDIYGLATALEAEDLLGDDERALTANDIFPVLEALDARGVDLTLAEKSE